MLEFLIIIQTIVLIVLLIVFLIFFSGIKKEGKNLKENLSKLESEIIPILKETQSLIMNLNCISNSVKEITEDVKEVSNKVRVSVSSVDNILNLFKKKIDSTKKKTSLFKIGLQAGASSLLGYYLKKLQKKEDQNEL